MSRSSENDQRLLPLEIAGLVERGKRAIARHKAARQAEEAQSSNCE